MLKLRHLFDNRDLALMLLGNWEYDKNNIDILKFFRISANAIYPYTHNGKTFLLRFIPWDEKTENEMEKELAFIQYLQKKGLNVLEPVLPKDGNYLLKKDTPWGKYLACAFKRVDGKQLSEFEYSDEIVFCLGKTLGRLHKYSSEYNNVKKESCFEIIDEMEYFAQNKLKDNKELILKRIEETRDVFKKLPQNKSNFGLIHYDFELDNVFYEETPKRYFIIDFGSSMYHWYTMDIEQSLTNLKEEYSQNEFEHIKTLFINGYKTEYQIFEEEFKLFPMFRRFDDLRQYINLKDVVEETWDNEPEWMSELRETLNGIIMDIGNNLNKEEKIVENILFKELRSDDINSNILDHYNRYQEIKRCYRKEEGNWIIKDIEFIENWDKDKKDRVIKDFSKTINNGGSVFGAYDNNKLIGFAVLYNKVFGNRKQYIQLYCMHVSYDYRHKGIGKKLFELCIKKTGEVGIEKIYISANSSEETQNFYLSIGCIDAEEIDKELFEKEPYDRHMEHIIYGGNV